MASKGINKVILIGNLGAAPEQKVAKSGAAVSLFNVATSEHWKDKTTGELKEKTEWHKCLAFNRTAEIINQYLTKGSKVYIEGKLATRQWQDKAGNNRYSTEIIVDTIQMLDTKPQNGGYNQPQNGANNQPQNGANNQPQNRSQATPQNNEAFPFDDDEIPF